MDVNSKVFASRSLPQAVPDTVKLDPRFGRYGDQYVSNLYPDMVGFCCEGTYLTALVNNGTIGTGLAFGGAAVTTFSDTNVGLIIQNLDQSPSGTVGKRLYIDYIKLICTTAIGGVTTTPFFNLWAKTDNTLSRYTSAGTVIIPANSNMDVGSNSISKIVFGTPTVAASSSSARLIFRSLGRGVTGAPGVNDVITINFGSVEKAAGGQNLAQAIPAGVYISAPPVVLGPGHTFTLGSWAPAQSSAPVFEAEIGWWER
jgi:hypothetical protein